MRSPSPGGEVPQAQVYPQRFVRFLRQRADGYVEFVFSIDDPALGVELILPRRAYDHFCQDNHVRLIDDAQAFELDRDAQKWRYGRPGLYD